MLGSKGSYVKLYAVNGYGDENVLYQIMGMEKPNVIMHFTDPRFWGWLYMLERQLRKTTPITYLNIWDDLPYPMYNRPFYQSCDLLMAISKQTMNINRWVLGPENCCEVGDPNPNGKHVLHYVPHGINSDVFKPLPDDDPRMQQVRDQYMGGKKYKYVILYNSRNIQRKRTSNIMLAFRTFCDNLPEEERKQCAMFMHTEIKSDAGTDLIAVKEAFCPNNDIYFSQAKIPPDMMNIIYNIADVTINLSSSEGFGLSCAESIMSGTPVIVTVTGGLQDQIGQLDDEGKPVVFDADFGSNNWGKYKKHGPWAYPVHPVTRLIQGSIPTPYIFDDLARWEDAADGMMYWYLMGKEKREKCGAEGRRWAMNEGGINAKNMCNQFCAAMDYTLEKFQPVKRFGLYNPETDYVGNRMPGDKHMGFPIPTIDKEKVLKEIEEKTKGV
jgi:glycosyltransferase involved in cell wall biosynthesis